MNQFHATTIFAIHHNGQCSMSGDGQVTFGNAVVMKHTAKKVRKIFNGRVLAGFAGSVADAFTLFEMFEGKLEGILPPTASDADFGLMMAGEYHKKETFNNGKH